MSVMGRIERGKPSEAVDVEDRSCNPHARRDQGSEAVCRANTSKSSRTYRALKRAEVGGLREREESSEPAGVGVVSLENWEPPEILSDRKKRRFVGKKAMTADEHIGVLTSRVSHLRIQLNLLCPDLSGGRYCGIYILSRNGVVLYVGQSVNTFGRIAKHRSLGIDGTGESFDEVRIVWCLPEDLNTLERKYIQELKPSMNSAGLGRSYSPSVKVVGSPAVLLGDGFADHFVGEK